MIKDESPERRWFLPPSAKGGLKEFTDNKAAAKWPKVPRVIISAELESYIKYDDDGDATTMYTPLIIYEYNVAGKEYREAIA